jgi:E3 ubiquitin-protein ligase RFWD2
MSTTMHPNEEYDATGSCDSSNCMYCQIHAQRFGHIVDQYYHHEQVGGQEIRKRKCSGLCGGVSCSNLDQDKRLKTRSNSSLWDHAVIHPKFQVDEWLSRNAGSRQVPEYKYGWIELGNFVGCPRSMNTVREVAQKPWDVVSGLEFEERGWLLATAGVSKQVRVYSLSKLWEESADLNVRNENLSRDPIRMHRLASKLSSLAWNPFRAGVVSVGDYDGVLTEIDLETGHILHESDEHSGRRVWSVCHCSIQRGRLASGAEDGTVAIWDSSRDVVLRISPTVNRGKSKSPVTGIQISPWDSNLLCVSSADSNAYVYDLRNTASPMRVLAGHSRPVSYVKFLDQSTVVTAAIDSSLTSWNIDTIEKERVYRGHRNCKHFVGLSVRPGDGLISCGSETGEVFCYERDQSIPIAVRPSSNTSQSTSESETDVFCSSVAWQPASAACSGAPAVMASAFTDGTIRILGLKRDSGS